MKKVCHVYIRYKIVYLVLQLVCAGKSLPHDGIGLTKLRFVPCNDKALRQRLLNVFFYDNVSFIFGNSSRQPLYCVFIHKMEASTNYESKIFCIIQLANCYRPCCG